MKTKYYHYFSLKEPKEVAGEKIIKNQKARVNEGGRKSEQIMIS